MQILQASRWLTDLLCSFRDDGVGLAAPQVGVNLKLMVFNPEGVRGQGEEIVLANPKIVSTGKKKSFHEEGCLSFKSNTGIMVLGDVEVHLTNSDSGFCTCDSEELVCCE
jgi:peptide deformylase